MDFFDLVKKRQQLLKTFKQHKIPVKRSFLDDIDCDIRSVAHPPKEIFISLLEDYLSLCFTFLDFEFPPINEIYKFEPHSFWHYQGYDSMRTITLSGISDKNKQHLVQKFANLEVLLTKSQDNGFEQRFPTFSLRKEKGEYNLVYFDYISSPGKWGFTKEALIPISKDEIKALISAEFGV